MKRYKIARAGVWQKVKLKGYRMQCCDCGLVHVLEFQVVDGQVEMRGWRDNRATEGVRKARGIRVA